MSEAAVRVFVQARMSSRRFPGKVLAPFAGRPLIDHVVSRISSAVPGVPIVLATSVERSDDPLASYVAGLGIEVYRGPLDDVAERFRGCLRSHPCDWFFRVCADSPLLNETLFVRMLDRRADGVDLISNVFPRSFPKGQSLELVRASTFQQLDPRELSADEREHVTRVFYSRPEQFRIVNIASDGPDESRTSVAIDTVDDLRSLEASL